MYTQRFTLGIEQGENMRIQPVMTMSHNLLFATRSLQPSPVHIGTVPLLAVFLRHRY